MLAAGSLKAINMMAERPEMFTDLREKCQVMHDAFDGIDGLELSGDRLSPVKHLRLAESMRKSQEDDKKLLKKIVIAVSSGCTCPFVPKPKSIIFTIRKSGLAFVAFSPLGLLEILPPKFLMSVFESHLPT